MCIVMSVRSDSRGKNFLKHFIAPISAVFGFPSVSGLILFTIRVIPLRQFRVLAIFC